MSGISRGTTSVMEIYQITAPEHFNFNCPDEWPRWICKFKRFRIASGLSEKAEASQVNTLVYILWENQQTTY